MTRTPPAGRECIFLLPSSKEDDGAGQKAKAALAVIANVPASAWGQPSKITIGQTLTAHYGAGQKIVALFRDTDGDPGSDLILHGISTGPIDPYKPRFIIRLKDLEFRVKPDAVNAETIKAFCRHLVIIDHEELDAIDGIKPRVDNETPLDRVTENLVSILMTQMPDDGANNFNPQFIPSNNPAAQSVANIMDLQTTTSNAIAIPKSVPDEKFKEASRKSREILALDNQERLQVSIASIDFSLSGAIADPVHAMLSVRILNDLRARFTSTPPAESE